MQSKEWLKIKEVFAETIELPEPKRQSFLSNYDQFIQTEVNKLLKSYKLLDNFIEKPAIEDVGLNEESLIGKQIGNYKITEIIGEGGMGLVFLAERQGFQQNVALKLLKRGMDTRAILKRFFLERQILSRLNHPNIAKLLDGGTTNDGLPYFVMEYVEGKSLLEFCDDQCFSITERLELFRKVCDAVSYAHQNLIVHRDLKPSNIIIIKDGTPKLLDFGIAKLLNPDSENTATQARIFTPEYASPEQLNGLPITTTTDVYSLGVLLYELLSGVRPFQTKSKNYAEIANLILTYEPLRPSSVFSKDWSAVRNTSKNNLKTQPENNLKFKIQNLKSLQGDLDNIILKAIRKEPHERYASVQEFSEDIRRHLQGLPVTATADSTHYRITKFIGRHRRGVFITALVSLVIFSLSGLSIYQGIVATRERDKANQRFEKLRDVAKLLMNDTRDSLTKIPGTVQIQKSLTEKSVELLDSIYDENTTDTQFLSELADSYDRLARTMRWEIRDFEKAQKSSERAIEIRRRIIKLEPDNLNRKEKLFISIDGLLELFSMKGDKEKVSESIKECEIICRELAEKEPTEKRRADLAQYLLGISENLKNWEMFAESKTYQKEGSEILQKLIDGYNGRDLTPREKTDLAWLLMHQADIYKDSENDEKALQDFQRAAELAKSAYQADKSIQLAFNHTSRTHRDLGEIYERRGDYKKAYEMYLFSFDWLKTREKDTTQPKINFTHPFLFYANRCALMLNKLGRKKEADEMIAKPLKDYLALLDSEENAATLVFSHEAFMDLSTYFTETNRPEKAIELWQQYFDRVQKFLDKTPEDMGFLNAQAQAQTNIGEIYSTYNGKPNSFRIPDNERLKKAKFHYQKAAELYRKSQVMYQPTQLEKDNLQKIEKKIENLNQ